MDSVIIALIILERKVHKPLFANLTNVIKTRLS